MLGLPLRRPPRSCPPAELAHTIWNTLADTTDSPDVALTLSREQYLAAIVPGPSQLQQGGATWAAGQMAAQDLGRPAAAATAVGGSGRGGGAQPADLAIPEEAQPAVIETALKLLKAVSVRAPACCCTLVGGSAGVAGMAGRTRAALGAQRPCRRFAA